MLVLTRSIFFILTKCVGLPLSDRKSRKTDFSESTSGNVLLSGAFQRADSKKLFSKPESAQNSASEPLLRTRLRDVVLNENRAFLWFSHFGAGTYSQIKMSQLGKTECAIVFSAQSYPPTAKTSVLELSGGNFFNYHKSSIIRRQGSKSAQFFVAKSAQF